MRARRHTSWALGILLVACRYDVGDIPVRGGTGGGGGLTNRESGTSGGSETGASDAGGTTAEGGADASAPGARTGSGGTRGSGGTMGSGSATGSAGTAGSGSSDGHDGATSGGTSGGDAGTGGMAGSGGALSSITWAIVGRSPAPAATDVDTRTMITVDTGITGASGPDATAKGGLSLDHDGVAVPSFTVVTDGVVTLVPNGPLEMSQTYTVTLQNPLTGSPTQWSFTTGDGKWRPKIDISANVLAFGSAARGDLRVVAFRTAGGVYLSRSVRGAPWTTPELLAVAPFVTPSFVRVGVDAAGRVVVAWDSEIGAGQGALTIRVRRYDGAWGNIVRLETSTDVCTQQAIKDCSASEPQLAVSANGDAVVAWERWNAQLSHVWATTLEGATGRWATSGPIDAGSAAQEPGVAIDGTGRAAVVWTEIDKGSGNPGVDSGPAPTRNETTRVNRFATGAWVGALTLEPDAAGGSGDPGVSMNEAGDILAAWTLFKSGSGTPRVSRFTWTSTWSAPVNVAGAGVNGGVTGIAAQASGIGLAAWGGRSPDAVTVAALTQPGATWNLPFPVTGASVLVYEAWPHLDDAGRGIVAWIYQSDVRISRSTSVSNRQWTTPVALTATHSVGALRAAMDGPSGRAVLAVLDSGNLSALEFD